MNKILLAVGLSALAAPAFAAEHTIKMLNTGPSGDIMVFEPAYLKAAPGDTVTFVPTDAGHNSASTYVPEGAQSWTGAIGEKVAVKLGKEGVYLYQCTPHLPLGMVGVIQVGDKKTASMKQVKLAADGMNAAIATNKDRLQNYLSQIK